MFLSLDYQKIMSKGLNISADISHKNINTDDFQIKAFDHSTYFLIN